MKIETAACKGIRGAWHDEGTHGCSRLVSPQPNPPYLGGRYVQYLLFVFSFNPGPFLFLSQCLWGEWLYWIRYSWFSCHNSFESQWLFCFVSGWPASHCFDCFDYLFVLIVCLFWLFVLIVLFVLTWLCFMSLVGWPPTSIRHTLPFCLFVFLSFCLYVFLSFCLFVFLSFCLFVFLSFP